MLLVIVLVLGGGGAAGAEALFLVALLVFVPVVLLPLGLAAADCWCRESRARCGQYTQYQVVVGRPMVSRRRAVW